VAEEVWSWWKPGSIHLAPWPAADEIRSVLGAEDEASDLALGVAADTLGEIRRHKSEAQRPMRTPVAHLVVRVLPERRAAFDAIRADLCAAGYVQQLEVVEAAEPGVSVELADPEPATKEPTA
jgi:valyl-tRNA synthetase